LPGFLEVNDGRLFYVESSFKSQGRLKATKGKVISKEYDEAVIKKMEEWEK
jgi:hypothetical protein